MTRIAPVRLNLNPRTFWFDAGDLELRKDQKVVVETVRGTELATVSQNIFEATDEQVDSLKTPLKPVVRIATNEDIETAREMERLSAEALPIFRQLAAETNENMRPISVEYLLDGDKAVFYFEAEDRVDFRDLVKRLASEFHVRVDMRQIGVRDEARMVGGLGHCGQELCCARMGGEFNPVSIRMAKAQDLSLNPQKISGICGRLMCCLRYEYDAYKDFNARAPKKNALITTPDGMAKVTELDVPREIITLKLEGEEGKTVKIPLEGFVAVEPTKENEQPRPNEVDPEAWEEALSRDNVSDRIEGLFLTSQFTGTDKLGSAQAVHHTSSSKDADEKKSGRRRSRGQRGGKTTEPQASAATERKTRRRSTKVSSGQAGAAGAGKAAGGAKAPAAVSGSASRDVKQQAQPGGVRPGHRSSGLRGRSGAAATSTGANATANTKGAKTEGQARRGKAAPSGSASEKGRNAGAPQARPAQKKQKPQTRKPNQTSNQAFSRDVTSRDAVSRDATPPKSGANEHRRARRRSHKANGPAGDTATSE